MEGVSNGDGETWPPPENRMEGGKLRSEGSCKATGWTWSSVQRWVAASDGQEEEPIRTRDIYVNNRITINFIMLMGLFENIRIVIINRDPN